MPSLNGLDPRLAELVCQIRATDESRATFKSQEIWVTFPVLLEDPSKDASWMYGREIRQLAYSLLFAAYNCLTIDGIPCVTESLRKGQRITQDVVELQSAAGTKISNAAKLIIANLATLSNTVNNSVAQRSRDHVLWALTSVLNQRAEVGKSAIPSTTIRQYLGLNHPGSQSHLSNKKPKPSKLDHETQWILLHLNANVQSILYSLRMLRQTCVFLNDNASNHTTATSDGEDFAKLLRRLESMPPIQDLFLDVDGVRALIRRMPLAAGDPVYKQLFPSDIPNSQGSSLAEVRERRIIENTMEEVTTRKKKRRKHGKGGGGDEQNARKERPDGPGNKFKSTNPFDLLG